MSDDYEGRHRRDDGVPFRLAPLPPRTGRTRRLAAPVNDTATDLVREHAENAPHLHPDGSRE